MLLLQRYITIFFFGNGNRRYSRVLVLFFFVAIQSFLFSGKNVRKFTHRLRRHSSTVSSEKVIVVQQQQQQQLSCPDLDIMDGQLFNASSVRSQDQLHPSSDAIRRRSVGYPHYNYGYNDRPHGLHIAFLGDSITRYQSLSLSHYLHTGYWLDDDSQLLTDKKTGKTWMQFFQSHVDYFGAAHFQCDCFRNEWRKEVYIKTVTENRYHYDPCRDNVIYTMNRFGKVPFRGHYAAATTNAWRTNNNNNSNNNNKTTVILPPLITS